MNRHLLAIRHLELIDEPFGDEVRSLMSALPDVIASLEEVSTDAAPVADWAAELMERVVRAHNQYGSEGSEVRSIDDLVGPDLPFNFGSTPTAARYGRYLEAHPQTGCEL